MESPDLKSTPPDDAAFEAWLRASSTPPPLADDGFSRRVLTALPRSFQRRVQRSVGCIAAVILGSALALAGVLRAGHGVTDALFISLENPLATPPALLAFGVTAVSLWYAFRHRVRLQPR